MNCQESIDAFETLRARYIIGAKVSYDNDIQYIMEWKDSIYPEILAAGEVKAKWPESLVQFLEKRIKFLQPNNPDPIDEFEREGLGEAELIDGEPPARILGCAYIGGLQYWCEWNNLRRKIIGSQDVLLFKNDTLINFLEDKLVDSGDEEIPGRRMSTRAMTQKASQLGFSYATKPVIFRNIELEKYILEKPSKVVERRRTHIGGPINHDQIDGNIELDQLDHIDPPIEVLVTPELQIPDVPIAQKVPVTLKLKVAIPFGVRGRKRRLNSMPALT